MNWDEDRYNEITEKLGNFLTQAGFRKSNLSYIPVSGLTGENLIKKSELVPWYQGLSLIDLIGNNPCLFIYLYSSFCFCYINILIALLLHMTNT